MCLCQWQGQNGYARASIHSLVLTCATGRPLIYARPYRDDLIKESVDTLTKFKHLVYWVEKGSVTLIPLS